MTDPHDSGAKTDGTLTGFGHLATRHARRAEDQQLLDNVDRRAEDDDQQDGTSSLAADKTAKHDPRGALVALAVSAAITPEIEETLKGKSPQAVVVSVPTSDWVEPVKDFFEDRAFGRKWSCVARDGSDRTRHKPTFGNAVVASDLAAGHSVVGIAVGPERLLPATLIAAADLRITVAFDQGVLVRTIGAVYGGAPPDLGEADLIGLGFDDIVAAMRPHSDAHGAVSRIAAAAKVRAGDNGSDDVPDLTTATEYGLAREWGLALARDLREYKAGNLSWSAIDRGAVFHSGPGMGKSVLARSLARACGVPLIVGSMGELFATSSGYLDGIIKSMRELFARAAAAAPCILFLDEIDGLPSRESLDSRNRDWWMPVIEDFMLQLDDATSGKREGVVVIGATNRIGAVDPAILRPGRLERAIEIVAPGPDGILNILRFHVRGSLSDDELREIVGLFEGSTPAEIMETVRRARRKARHDRRDLSIADLRNAALPELELPADALRRIAFHEAGHVVSAEFFGRRRVRSVRIGGRDGVGGLTTMNEQSDDLQTRTWIEQRVVEVLSGRAAEIVLLGEASVGAGGNERSDLATATRMLAAATLSCGLAGDDLIYLASAEDALAELRLDPAARRRVNDDLKRLQARAIEIVRERRTQVADIADTLLRRRFLTATDIEAILATGSSPSPGDPIGDPPRRGS
ncbi:AAA family ATPase [Bradyrhizobium genosp. P]|uniref:AAA family ATPase n=1 Tax=Bradyrhizobium genosp. P TaxID=83641 RepID=UPI003CF1802A